MSMKHSGMRLKHLIGFITICMLMTGEFAWKETVGGRLQEAGAALAVRAEQEKHMEFSVAKAQVLSNDKELLDMGVVALGRWAGTGEMEVRRLGYDYTLKAKRVKVGAGKALKARKGRNGRRVIRVLKLATANKRSGIIY